MPPLLIALVLSALTFAQRSPEPRGYYSNGHLLLARELPLEGDGYMRLFLHRDRGWGTQEMIDLLQRTAFMMNQRFPMRDRLQTGDLSAMTGGQITRHNSHQNGLDVDLTYYRTNGMEQLPDIFDGFVEDMVLNGKISPNFDHERNWELMKTLHRHGGVQRIFVDQVIKNELCAYARALGEHDSEAEVLRSLRHQTNHVHHLHVRLRCPVKAPQCVPQEDPPLGSGCEG